MKTTRILIIAIMLSMVASLFVACGNNEEKKKSGLSVYYVSKSENTVVTEQHNLKNKSTIQSICEILDCLTTQGKEQNYKSAIPKSVKVNGYDFLDGVVKIDFSKKYYDLSSKRELLLRSSVVLSLIQLKSVEYVAFTVEGKPCTGKDGKYLNAMNASDFVSDLGNNKQDKQDFILYFSNEKGTALKEYKLKNVKYGNKTKERYIVEQLIKGPSRKGFVGTLSSQIKILSVVTANSICYVDFDSNFLTERNQVAPKVVIYSIVNSLSELDKVHKVQISVRGETSIKYNEEISLEQPFIRNLDLIK